MNKVIVNSPNQLITFGKHKGNSFAYILEEHPSYIVWLSDNDIVEFPPEFLDKAESMSIEESRNYSSWGSSNQDPSDDYIYSGCDPIADRHNGSLFLPFVNALKAQTGSIKEVSTTLGE